MNISDLSILKQISINTFIETFSKDNTPEDTQKYIDTNFTDEKILSEINTHGSKFFLAFMDENPAAYLKLNTGEAQTEKQGKDSMEIQRIYVLSKFKVNEDYEIIKKTNEEQDAYAFEYSQYLTYLF